MKKLSKAQVEKISNTKLFTNTRTRRTPKEVAILVEKVGKLLAKGKTQKFISEKLNLTASYTQYLASKVAKEDHISAYLASQEYLDSKVDIKPPVTNEDILKSVEGLYAIIKKGFKGKIQVSVDEELVLLEKTTPKKFFGITYSTTTTCEFVVKTTFTYGKEVVTIYNVKDLLKLKIWLYSINSSQKMINKVVDHYQRKLAEEKKAKEEDIPNFDFSVKSL